MYLSAWRARKLTIERVPGSHEIPVALSLILNSGDYSCLIALGVVIKGQPPTII